MKIYIVLVFILIGFATEAQWLNDDFITTTTPLSAGNTQRINNTPKKPMQLSPVMGWNSWDNYGLDITEEEFKAQVDYVATYLKPFGYTYMTIDAGWYAPCLSADKDNPCYKDNLTKYNTLTDANGVWIPTPNRFPSAKNGSFKALADYVHSKGLKFGLHIQRGIPWDAVDKDKPILGTKLRAKDIANTADNCLWWDATVGVDMSKPGAQEYYNSCFKSYAAWGVDLVKVDDLSYPYHADEITAYRMAIEASGRNMVFSLSPGSTPTQVRHHVMTHSDMWRISADFWDTWPQLKKQFDIVEKWMIWQSEGHYADLDMLPVGIVGSRSDDAGSTGRRSRFTNDELQTMMGLWCMFKSPLILGGDVTQLTDFEKNLITNKDLIAINQSSKKRKKISRVDDKFIMTCESGDGKNVFIALFNLTDADAIIDVSAKDIGVVRNAEAQNLLVAGTVNIADKLSVDVAKHGVAIFKVVK